MGARSRSLDVHHYLYVNCWSGGRNREMGAIVLVSIYIGLPGIVLLVCGFVEVVNAKHTADHQW